jgi:hypothetical protein
MKKVVAPQYNHGAIRGVDLSQGRLEWCFRAEYGAGVAELNPGLCWNHLKKQGVSKKPLLQNESLRQRVNADLLHIQSLVRSFFKAFWCLYNGLGSKGLVVHVLCLSFARRCSPGGGRRDAR